MRGLPLLLTCLLASAVMLDAATPKRTTRTMRPTTQMAAADTIVPEPESPFDTITPPPGQVRVSGFEKTLPARKESFFMTNNGSDTLQSVCLEIEYRDLRGRQLHRRAMWVDAGLPPGQTRRYDIPTWDRQHTFYYRIHPRPRRRDAVPFDIVIEVSAAVINHQLPKTP